MNKITSMAVIAMLAVVTVLITCCKKDDPIDDSTKVLSFERIGSDEIVKGMLNSEIITPGTGYSVTKGDVLYFYYDEDQSSGIPENATFEEMSVDPIVQAAGDSKNIVIRVYYKPETPVLNSQSDGYITETDSFIAIRVK